jgi:hypothetical protein
MNDVVARKKYIVSRKKIRRCERRNTSLRAKRGNPSPRASKMDGRAALAMTEFEMAALRSP